MKLEWQLRLTTAWISYTWNALAVLRHDDTEGKIHWNINHSIQIHSANGLIVTAPGKLMVYRREDFIIDLSRGSTIVVHIVKVICFSFVLLICVMCTSKTSYVSLWISLSINWIKVGILKDSLFTRDLSCSSTQERKRDSKNEAITTIIYEWSFIYTTVLSTIFSNFYVNVEVFWNLPTETQVDFSQYLVDLGHIRLKINENSNFYISKKN